jgi:hypothetical protein
MIKILLLLAGFTQFTVDTTLPPPWKFITKDVNEHIWGFNPKSVDFSVDATHNAIAYMDVQDFSEKQHYFVSLSILECMNKQEGSIRIWKFDPDKKQDTSPGYAEFRYDMRENKEHTLIFGLIGNTLCSYTREASRLAKQRIGGLKP